MKNTVRVISILLIVIMGLTSTAFAVGDGLNGQITSNAQAEQRDREIQELFEKRSSLFINNDIKMDFNELNRIDKNLIALGVEFLTPDEARAQFTASKSREGAFSSNDQRISPPYASNVQWASYRTSNYLYSGKYYNIQRLIATPNTEKSNLKINGAATVKVDNDWEAGKLAAIESVVASAGGALIGEIPGGSFVMSFYDAISSLITGISKTTIIDVPSVQYTWSGVINASFAFVRLESETDDSQSMTYISTKVVDFLVLTQSAAFNYKNTNGTWVVTTKGMQNSRTFSRVPNGYDSIPSAVKAYTDATSARRATIDSIKIKGVEGKTITTVYPVSPNFPSHIG